MTKYIFPIIKKKKEEEERRRNERVPIRIYIDPPPEPIPDNDIDKSGSNGGVIDPPSIDKDIIIDYTIQYSV